MSIRTGERPHRVDAVSPSGPEPRHVAAAPEAGSAAARAADELDKAREAASRALELARDARTTLVGESHAASTREAYERDWAGFVAWCERIRPADPTMVPLPATDATLSLWLAAHRHLAPATLARRLSAVRLKHARERRPLDDALLPGTLATLRGHRIARRGVSSARPEAATERVVEAMAAALAAVGPDGAPTTLALRNRALLLVGYDTGLRRSALVGIRLEHLVRTSTGVRVRLPFSKGDRTGKGAWTAMLERPGSPLCPVRALDAWRATLDRSAGPLFVALHRARHTGVPGEKALSAAAVARVVARAASLAGLDGRFSAHSLRRGAITDAIEAGVPLDRVRAHVHHAHPSTTLGYVDGRAAEANHPRAAPKLDPPSRPSAAEPDARPGDAGTARPELLDR